MELASFDTPILTVDLDAVERNIARLQDYCDAHGLACRPHIKTHKLPSIAHLQVRAGAVGIACQKLGEAEVMVESGIDDVLLTFPLVSPTKAERLAALARQARISVVGDSEAVARNLSETLAREGLEVDFLVECDTGFARTGVQSATEAADLAETVERLPGLRFAGLMTYPTLLPDTGPWLDAARDELRRRRLGYDWVSSGGTPTAYRNHEVPEVTELRAGTYVYGDRGCVANGTVPLEDTALRVRAAVVSRPTRDRAILDCGSKTLTSDAVEVEGEGGFGYVVEHPEARLYTLHEEHGFLDVSACADGGPDIGEVVTIVPNHACGATNLHDEVLAHRSGGVVGLWPIPARGKLR